MITAAGFVAELEAQGFNLYASVPCSFFKPVVNYLIDNRPDTYVPLNNEGEAVAYACGAQLAGMQPVVMFQNSGLGNAVNPLTSLAQPFRIPLLVIVTWRGQPGIGDEPQHEIMGAATQSMLEAMEIETEVLAGDNEGLRAQMGRARTYLAEEQRSFALIMPKGSIEPYALQSTARTARPPLDEHTVEPEPGAPTLKRHDCIARIAEVVGQAHPIVATTGKAGRELFTLRDSANQLYMVGSMGCASTLGLGMARHRAAGQHAADQRGSDQRGSDQRGSDQRGSDQRDAELRTVVIDGDGAALMRLEAMASVGHYRPEGLVHVLLDNNAHESTGGQQTLSDTVDFTGVARSVGYRYARSLVSEATLDAELRAALERPGPSLLHVRILEGSVDPLGRPTMHPSQVAERLRRYLAGNGA